MEFLHMIETKFETIRISKANGIATIKIDNPPVNVLDVRLMREMRQFLTATRDDKYTRVLVFESADPEFFIAHVDMTLIDEPYGFDDLVPDAPEGLNPFQAPGELLRAQAGRYRAWWRRGIRRSCRHGICR
jgi:enoyl-CoA hydratase/carnithine racemase